MTRFGLQIPGFAFPGVADTEMFEHVADLARAAERTGMSSVWVMDHFWQLPPLGGPSQPILEGYTLLGALAARTQRVELGTLVTGVTYRNPAILAKMVTTLDVISGGRAVLGIGAAWFEEEHVGLGVDFPPVRERMDRLDEALRVCRAMFTEDAPSFDGRYYRIREARNLPRPVRPGGPPILVGGSGERRTLRLVAQHADRCNIMGSPDTIRHKLEVLHGHCRDLGRDPAAIEVTALYTLVLTGSAEETDQVEGFLRAAMGDDATERAIWGTPEQVVERVSALAAAGVDEVIVNMPTADLPTVERAGELLVSACD